MKILLINYEFPPLGGGAGNATYYMAREAAKLGHEVVVLTASFKNLLKEELLDGFRIVRIKCLRKRVDRSNPVEMASFIFSAFLNAKKIFVGFRPDLVIAVMAIPSGVVAWHLKNKYSIPYIISLQGGDVPGWLPKDLSFYHYLVGPLTKIVWKSAINIVANSHGLQELAQKTGDLVGKKIYMIPNGIDLDRFRPREGSGGNIKILFVGRLVEQKGLSHLLDALAFIRADLAANNVSVEIAGDGPLRSKLEAQSKSLGLTGYVKFRGWIKKTELPEAYQSADIFILPSIDEGMPNVLSEAMASGLAIIASDIGGNNELVNHGINGFLVKAGDDRDLAEKISQLIGHRDLIQNFGRASREAISKYSWSDLIKQYLSYAG